MSINYKSAVQEFNPYISEIPIDAYLKVGMTTQAREEEGIQKIQGTLDQIAGLDIANQGGKEYLQGRVNELTNSLNKYGYADFSKRDNVRALQSLATPIYSDSNIVKDVANTYQYRQLAKDQQDALKSGKAENFSIAYENIEKVQPWLNSRVAGEDYNAGSSTLRGTIDEVRKKFEAAFDKFKPYKSSNMTDGGKDGAYWIQSEKTWMDKDRLSNYILSQMDGNDLELLKRSGWSKLSVLDDGALKGTATNLYQKLWNRENLKVSKANLDLRLHPVGTEEYNAANDIKKYYESSRNQYGIYDEKTKTFSGGIIGQINSMPKLSKADRETLYQSIESTLFADGLSSAWSYEENKTTFDINKVWDRITQENGLNYRNTQDNQTTLDVAAMKESGDGSGTGTKKSSTSKGKEDATGGLDETVTIGTATDEVKDATQINLDSIDGVINNIDNEQVEFKTQMMEYLNNNGFEDFFTIDRNAAQNSSGVTNINKLVLRADKASEFKHVLNKITGIVNDLAQGKPKDQIMESPEVDQNDLEAVNGTGRFAGNRLKKQQIENLLNDPNLTKLVSRQTELNIKRNN